MKLADFIERDMEAILAQWEAFAATQLPAAAKMSPIALRNHGQPILQAIVKDLRTPQTAEAQAEKSMGRAPKVLHATETAAQTHALLRARSGFDINQLAAEYRALRASVLRLWIPECLPAPPDTEDMIRFNEAVDQAVAESISFFHAQVEQSRNLLLGMLGHDMRSPLQTIQMTAAYLSKINAGEEVSEAVSRLIHGGARMKALLDDLLDFGRSQLGLSIPITPRDVDLREIFVAELQLLRGSYPNGNLQLSVAGDPHGHWDGVRLQQLLENLIINALKYGKQNAPVRVAVSSDGDSDVRVEVRNSGAVELQALDRMFDPLRRGNHGGDADQQDSGLGLGLYIAREIARAHGGDLTAASDGSETVFSLRMPRRV